MRILVTGAAGFLGRRVVARLSQSHEVVAVAKNDPSTIHGASETVCADLTEPSALDKLPRDIDVVCHLAARVVTTTADPSVLRDNIASTAAVLGYAERCGVSRLVYTSSCSVYPRPVHNLPVTEDTAIAPSGDYAQSKWQGEVQVSEAVRQTGMSAALLRCASIYGPGQAVSSVLPKFVELAKAGSDLTVHGSGFRSQDFVWVGDVAEAIALCIRQRWDGLATVFNVGSGQETTMLALARSVLRHFAASTGQAIRHTGDPEVEADRFWLDIGKLRGIGYRPAGLDEGLRLYANRELAACISA